SLRARDFFARQGARRGEQRRYGLCNEQRAAPCNAVLRKNIRSQRHSFTREIYSPVRVSTRRFSPSWMNSGTFTTAPVSSLAGFDPPDEVSPRRPGSVSTTFRLTWFGGVTSS